jgi:hypothetical protein
MWVGNGVLQTATAPRTVTRHELTGIFLFCCFACCTSGKYAIPYFFLKTAANSSGDICNRKTKQNKNNKKRTEKKKSTTYTFPEDECSNKMAML